MNKYCNKCIVHCLFMLVNTLINVNKWHLIVKCYHNMFKLSTTITKTKTEIKLNLRYVESLNRSYKLKC